MQPCSAERRGTINGATNTQTPLLISRGNRDEVGDFCDVFAALQRQLLLRARLMWMRTELPGVVRPWRNDWAKNWCPMSGFALGGAVVDAGSHFGPGPAPAADVIAQ